jgi:gamma-carbonic anhydrase
VSGPIILPYEGIMPTIHPDAWIAPGAVVIGDVHIGADTNVWFGVVIRGDVNTIRIGERTNIQDGTIVHVTRKTGPTVIGSDVTIGHNATIHACTLEDFAFVGMHSAVLDFAVVESGGFLAAGALLTPKKRLPSGQMFAGNPAKYFRDLTQEEKDYIPFSAKHYVELSRKYKR